MATMNVLIKDRPERGLWMGSAPIPTPRHGEVKIKIKKAAICGTDMHIWEYGSWAQKKMSLPTVTGHEYFGIVEEVGEGCERIKLGMRVSGEGHIPCHNCRACRTNQQHLCPYTVNVGITYSGSFCGIFGYPRGKCHTHPRSP